MLLRWQVNAAEPRLKSGSTSIGKNSRTARCTRTILEFKYLSKAKEVFLDSALSYCVEHCTCLIQYLLARKDWRSTNNKRNSGLRMAGLKVRDLAALKGK